MTSNNIFRTSEILNIRIKTIQQRINKLEADKQENGLSASEERELSELYVKLKPLSRRLTELHQLILDYSVRIKSDTERFIVVEYFVNHTPCPVIANQDFYDRSGIYKIIRKYKKEKLKI